MALARDDDGHVERLFSGHEPDGGTARSGRHEHIFLAADDEDGDGAINRVLVIAPWRGDTTWKPNPELREAFARIVGTLTAVRAGKLGVIALSPAQAPEPGDPVFAATQVWITRVPITPDRHPRREDAGIAIARDLAASCQRRGFPGPEVEATKVKGRGLRPTARWPTGN